VRHSPVDWAGRTCIYPTGGLAELGLFHRTETNVAGVVGPACHGDGQSPRRQFGGAGVSRLWRRLNFQSLGLAQIQFVHLEGTESSGICLTRPRAGSSKFDVLIRF